MSQDSPLQGLCLGHPDIAEQHRLLLHMLGELLESMGQGAHRPDVLDALQDILTLAAEHFEDEEALMEDTNWDGLDRHEGLHAEFLWKIGDFEARFQNGDPSASREELLCLHNGLIAHFTVEDRAFFENAMQ